MSIRKIKQTFSAVGGLVAASLLIPSGQVVAQEGATLEEITVTARRYEESINDAPLAVNVLSGEYLEAQGTNNLSDIIELTPGAT